VEKSVLEQGALMLPISKGVFGIVQGLNVVYFFI